MKIKLMLIVVLLCFDTSIAESVRIDDASQPTEVLALTQKTNRVDITTLSGTTYSNCKTTKVEPDGVTYLHSRGVVKLLYTELPPEIQSYYDYNPAKARVYSSIQTDMPYWFNRIGSDYGIFKGKLVKNGKDASRIYGRVISVTDSILIIIDEFKGTVALKVSDTSSFIDNSYVSFLAKPIGIYEYTTVLGANARVKFYDQIPQITYEQFVTYGENAFPEIAEGRRIATQQEKDRFAIKRAMELEEARVRAKELDEEERRWKKKRHENDKLKSPWDNKK